MNDDVARWRTAADEAVEAWDSLEARLQVPPDTRITFEVGYPLAGHAMNHVRAGIELFDTHARVARSCARIALEHAMVAQWALLTDSGAETVLSRMLNSNRTEALDLLTAADADDALRLLASDDFRSLANTPKSTGAGASFNLKTVFDRFSGTPLFYAMYRELSDTVHPSLGTIRAFFDPRGGSRKLDRHGRLGDEDIKDRTAQGLGLGAVLALDFVERCRVSEGTDGRSRAPDIAQRAGLPHDLRYSDQATPPPAT